MLRMEFISVIFSFLLLFLLYLSTQPHQMSLQSFFKQIDCRIALGLQVSKGFSTLQSEDYITFFWLQKDRIVKMYIDIIIITQGRCAFLLLKLQPHCVSNMHFEIWYIPVYKQFTQQKFTCSITIHKYKLHKMYQIQYLIFFY